MIVSQFQEIRRFMGRLDAGQDVAAGLKTVCRENNISSAWIMAVAVLRNPLLAPVLGDGKGLGEPITLQGAVFCPSVSGNVSIEGEGVHLRLYSSCHPADGTSSVPMGMGLIRSGEVVMCEFFLVALDDAAMVRAPLDGTNFGHWVQLQAAAEIRSSRPPTQRAPEGPAQRPTPPPAYVVPDEDESSDLNILDMKEGDYVDHPKFGQCRIVHAPLDEKISIRLPNGKHVDLHLGVMRVLAARQVGGRKVFQVEVRRKVV